MKIIQLFITLNKFKKLYSSPDLQSIHFSLSKIDIGSIFIFFLKTLILFLLPNYAINMMKQSLKTPLDMKFTFQYLKWWLKCALQFQHFLLHKNYVHRQNGHGKWFVCFQNGYTWWQKHLISWLGHFFWQLLFIADDHTKIIELSNENFLVRC